MKFHTDTKHVMAVRYECALMATCWVCYSVTTDGEADIEVSLQPIEVAG